MAVWWEQKWLTVAVFVIAAGIPFAVAMLVHRRLLRGRARCRDAWSLVRAELEKRSGLVPDLLVKLRRHADRDGLEETYESNRRAMRTLDDARQETRCANDLVRCLRPVIAAGCRDDALCRDAHFIDLDRTFRDNDVRVQGATRSYNANAKDFNERLETFPANFVAALLGLPDEPYLVIDPVFEPEAAIVAAPERSVAASAGHRSTADGIGA